VFFSISLHLIDNPPVILPNRRPDHGFDNLIQNIYGDITALEKQEEQEIEKLNRDKHMNNAYAESRMRGILNQAIQRVSFNMLINGTGALHRLNGPVLLSRCNQICRTI
jgi:hypothetical protein